MFSQTYVQVLADKADECVVVRLTQFFRNYVPHPAK
jgi:hypothetical protein